MAHLRPALLSLVHPLVWRGTCLSGSALKKEGGVAGWPCTGRHCIAWLLRGVVGFQSVRAGNESGTAGPLSSFHRGAP